jgi:hypothetical protein
VQGLWEPGRADSSDEDTMVVRDKESYEVSAGMALLLYTSWYLHVLRALDPDDTALFGGTAAGGRVLG